jgi:hypothetical protein
MLKQAWRKCIWVELLTNEFSIVFFVNCLVVNTLEFQPMVTMIFIRFKEFDCSFGGRVEV